MKISRIRLTNWKSFADTGELEMDRINVIVGRNNSGKSAILRALMLMQTQGTSTSNVRLGAPYAAVKVTLTGDSLSDDLVRHFRSGTITQDEAVLTMTLGASPDGNTAFTQANRQFDVFGNNYSPPHIEPHEPRNFIYPYFSKRKVGSFNQQVDRNVTNAVNETLDNLVAKVDRLASPDYFGEKEYTELCRRVLGFRIGAYASTGGKQAGLSIGRFDHIALEEMGEGVSSLLGLITDLCMADGHLFLIEEPENDVHPESLKALLNVIIEKSAENQFIITTHSNIVTRYLGAAENSKLFVVESDFETQKTPTSNIREIDSDPDSRIAVLRDLGYELSDFYLWDGWLILEESSAQTVIQYLIEWFVQRLMRVRIVSASGVDNVEPMLKEYRRLFLFAHLEPHYKERTWAIVDGDDAGTRVVASLKKDLRSWPQDRFRALGEKNFEYYYPPQFRDEADAALALTDKAKKKEAKRVLVNKVDQWCKENPGEARAAFDQSAAEVIAILKEIDDSLFGR
ncbi:ATP-dependent endonuclease [Streptomyces sp. NPDC002573]|uniref:ATP-dependent nuclease n=1 Tax=Streptomyces sp. NPDC002573 TaxID=3364651 RepID=UPI0036A799CB